MYMQDCLQHQQSVVLCSTSLAIQTALTMQSSGMADAMCFAFLQLLR